MANKLKWEVCEAGFGGHYILQGPISDEWLLKTFRKKLRRLPYGIKHNQWAMGHCGFDFSGETHFHPWRPIVEEK